MNLVVKDLRKNYGGVKALDGVDLELRPRSITGLIGPNGAGKTTLFDCVTGFQKPDSGKVELDGLRIDGLPPHRITRLGMARTFQLVRLLPRLSALDNLMVATPDHPGETLTGALLGGWGRREREAKEHAASWLEFVGMSERQDVLGQNLSYGQSKLVEIARMLSLGAEVLMMDEPMAGINPTLRRRILRLIHDLREKEGKTFLIIEHDIEMIMAECDEVIVMDQGRIIAQGPPSVVQKDPRVIEAYLGKAPEDA